MPSELDRKFDAVLAQVMGPGGRIQIAEDGEGRKIVANLPPTLPGMFDAFCMLHGATTAVIADGERLTFAQLNEQATRLARALAGGWGVGKGDRVAIAMRNCPSWIVAYMAVLKAGRVATLVNGWWQPDELRHGLALTEPCLVLCDAPRAKRLEATGLGIASVVLPIEKPIAEAIAPLLGRGEADLPEIAPEDDATILFTSGSTGMAKGALSTHRAVTTGIYTYSVSLMALLGIMESEGRPPANPPRTLVNVPLFHVTGEVPVLLNSFVIGRGMVLMAKWDPGEALRLIQDEKVTYFVGVPTMSLELMQHPDREKFDLSSLTDIAAGGAPRPVAHVKRLQESFRAPNRPSATASPRPMRWAAAISGRITPTSPPRPAGPTSRRSRSPFSARATATSPSARPARSRSAPRPISGAIGTIRRRPPRPSPPTAISRPATSAISTRRIICSSSTARRTSSSAAARTSAARRSRRRSTRTPRCRRRRCSEYPTRGSARCRRRSSTARTSGASTRDALRAFLDGRIASYKIPQYIWVHDEPLPKLGTGKIDKKTLRERYSAEVER